MKKRSLIVTGLAMVLFGATACTGTPSVDGSAPTDGGSETGSAKIGGSLVIYTPNEQDMLKALIPAFEKETGVKVELVTDDIDELYTRITTEVGDPQGDVLFGGGVAQAMSSSQLWQNHIGANNSAMIAIGQNVGGYSTPYQANGSVLLVNTDKVGSIKIESYRDLLNSELKGKIAFGDPTSSSSAFAQLTNMLMALGGDYTSKAGWDYVGKLLARTGGASISSADQVGQDLADGEYIVALTDEALSLSFVEAGSPVKIVYPREGTVFLPSGVEIIKDAKNLAQARAFCDWIQSEEAQQIIADSTNGRPLRADVAKEGVTTWTHINRLNEDSAYVSANRATIIAKFEALLAAVK
ncbi:MAG: extracellular solute-binding protein [Propionibacteriaceae bacterium]|jgi:iron(III) transport system substrate-binding protein|nr:extracellular solute-binding protein [Propionibacteriaceae bacterium]